MRGESHFIRVEERGGWELRVKVCTRRLKRRPPLTMKLPTATIVSASPDHFPGHLTCSLRRNATRRRSAPLLVRRRQPSQTAPPDPSSPVVTCFGQIRPSPAPSHRRRRCRCFPWRRWLLRPFRPTPMPPPPPPPPEILEATDPDDEEETDAVASAAAAAAVPPKNALLLMRSRSESRRGSAAEAGPPSAVPARSEPVILTRSRSEPCRVPSPDPWKSAAALELAGGR